jgi:tetratricopeptide (TPR) repeat protein
VKSLRQTNIILLLAAISLLAGCAAGPGGSGPSGPSPYEALIAAQRQKAAALAAQGNLRAAADAWKVALTIDPRDPVALEEIKKLDEQIKQAVADRLARGKDALKRNVHLEARNHFLAVLALDPGNREAFEALQTQVREVRQVNHTVRTGESLTSIAQFYYGDRTRSEVIWETNQLPPNPKLTPGMVLKIPEIPGLPLGRPEPAATAKTPPSGSAPATAGKTEAAEDEDYANPALAAAREALDRGEFALALSTVDRFLGQNPRNSEASDLRHTVLLQQGRTLMEQNKLVDAYSAANQLVKSYPKDSAATSLLTQVRGRLVQQHYNQGMQLFRDEKLPAAISEWRTVLQYDPAHDGAKRNIDQAQRLLKGLQERQQKQGK